METSKYHVTYGTRKRVFKSSPQCIKSKIEEHFQLKKYRLQAFDDEFDDWVDIDDDNNLEEMDGGPTKLNVVADLSETGKLPLIRHYCSIGHILEDALLTNALM